MPGTEFKQHLRTLLDQAHNRLSMTLHVVTSGAITALLAITEKFFDKCISVEWYHWWWAWVFLVSSLSLSLISKLFHTFAVRKFSINMEDNNISEDSKRPLILEWFTIWSLVASVGTLTLGMIFIFKFVTNNI
jgi:hypothetical protein